MYDILKRLLYPLILLLAVCGLSLSVYAKDGLRVYFVDIGQGDCELIECDGEYMLIDAGDTDKGQQVINFLEEMGVDKFKYIIATHPHADHIGGMADVINAYDADDFITTSKVATTKCYEKMLNALAEKNIQITTPVQGETFSLGGADFTIITPTDGVYTGDNMNCYSVGIKLTYGDTSFVMCGDAEEEEETLILQSDIDISADVYKCGHHGSRTSSSDDFLDRVNPEYAVISCGNDNSYGHPHKQTIDKLEKRGIKYFRTDEAGTISAESDGSSISINPLSGSTGWSRQDNGNNNAVFGMAFGVVSVIKQSSTYADRMYSIAERHDAAEDCSDADTYDKSVILSYENISEYVLNTNSKKFHVPSCSSVNKISAKNRQDTTESRDKIIGMGYSPCTNCNP